jgi:hypothetical protein
MGDILVELVLALFEIFGEFLLQLLFELAAEALTRLIKRKPQVEPVATGIALALGGAAAGLLSAWLIPHRLIATRPVLPGISLLLAPLATGYAMHLLGNRLRRAGRYASDLATFRGGALFAFSMAVIRWWLVGLPR